MRLAEFVTAVRRGIDASFENRALRPSFTWNDALRVATWRRGKFAGDIRRMAVPTAFGKAQVPYGKVHIVLRRDLPPESSYKPKPIVFVFALDEDSVQAAASAIVHHLGGGQLIPARAEA